MRRVAHNLVAALITFAIGVALTTLSGITLPRFAHLIGLGKSEPIADRRNDGCNEWHKSNGLGWDLTYLSLLRKSGTCPGELYCEHAAEKPQPPVNKHFDEWQGDTFISSILIELPDGHAAMGALWLIRTKQHAYWWNFHPDRHTSLGKQPLPTEVYDRAFETLKCWKQRDVANKKFFTGRADGDGYIGFLSLYEEGKSRQMLLTSTDIFEPRPDWSEIDDFPKEEMWGRLLKTFMPIYSALREQKTPVSKELRSWRIHIADPPATARWY